MAHATNGRHTDNWWLETIGSAITQDANGNGTLAVSGGSGGGATTIADGGDVAEGATTDAAVTAGAAGTISAKLRAISRDLTNGSAQFRGSNLEVAALTAGSLNADLYPSTDVSAYKYLSLQITGTWSGVLAIQGSNTGVSADFQNLQLVSSTSVASGLNGNITSNGLYEVAVRYRYLRIRMTSYTSGTANGVLELYSIPPVNVGTNVSAGQVGTWTTSSNTLRATIQASAAQTTTGNSSALTSAGPYTTALVTLNCTAASGTTPTLNVKLQASDDGGTTWYDIPSATFTQLTAAGTQAISIGGSTNSFGDTIRASWIIGGTTPSFTFAVKVVFKS